MKPQRKIPLKKAISAHVRYKNRSLEEFRLRPIAVAKYRELVKTATGKLSQWWYPKPGVKIFFNLISGLIVIDVEGGIFVTVADNTSGTAIYADVFQKRTDRLLYKTQNSHKVEHEFFAAGKFGNGVGLVDDLPSSFGTLNQWRDKKNALTWLVQPGTQLVGSRNQSVYFYIGGKPFVRSINLPYVTLHPSLGALATLYAAAYYDTTPAQITAYPDLDGFAKSLVMLWGTDDVWKIVIIGFNPSSSVTSAPVYIDCTLPVFYSTVVDSSIVKDTKVSGFAFDARTVYIATFTDAIETHQKIYKIVFNELYDDVTSTVIYDEIPYTASYSEVITGSDPIVIDITQTLTAGEPAIIHLKIDIDGSLCALRHQVTAYSFASTQTGTGFDLSDYSVSANTAQFFEVLGFTESSWSVIKTLPTINISQTKNYVAPDDYTESYVSMVVQILYYSAFKSAVLYKYDKRTQTTTSGPGFPISTSFVYTIEKTVNFFINATDTVIDSMNSGVITETGVLSESAFFFVILQPVPGAKIKDNTGVLYTASDFNIGVEFQSSANDKMLMACFTISGQKSTLLVNFNTPDDYILLNYRLDLPVSGDIPINYPIGITTRHI